LHAGARAGVHERRGSAAGDVSRPVPDGDAGDGYFFVDAVIGKHDLITYAVALTGDGKVRQTEILEYREAYGGEVRNAHWRAQFLGRQHGDPVRIGRDIQNISGATLSCEHLTDGIRRLLATYAIAIHR
jgi:FMN-binding domain